MIRDLADVVSLTRPDNLVGDERGNVIAVELRPGIDVPLERTFHGSSSCGVCGKTTISSLALRAPKVTGTLRAGVRLVASLPDRLRAAQPTFDATGGLHASAFFDGHGTLLAAREDVGRHNALDKLVGWALGARRLPASDVILVVSGRIGYEIVQKAIAAGVPIIAGVGAPSSLAVRIAEEFGVTLAGFVRAGSMNVYCGADRVI
jgi:FdhD protein